MADNLNAGTRAVATSLYAREPVRCHRPRTENCMTQISRIATTATLATAAAMHSIAVARPKSLIRTDFKYGSCFPIGGNLVYDKRAAGDVAECYERSDAQCAAFENWDHTLISKLNRGIPKEPPQPQTVFPKNQTKDAQGVSRQDQAKFGTKITGGF